jgi:DNA-binding winged helix-turn-helix (wHTH) protein
MLPGMAGLAERDMAERPVRLAAEPARTLGMLRIEPGHRRVTWPGGERILEPRVMQVLVALADAEGGIVGRDALIARCWDGRIVGENAINRVISLLRDLAEQSAAFEIETITKVGYRLLPNADSKMAVAPLAGAPASEAPSEDTPAELRGSPQLGRRGLMAGVLVAAAAAGGAWWMRQGSHPPREAVELTRHAIDNYRAGGLPDEQIIAQLQEAVRIAPDYAEAWGMLAFVYGNQWESPADRPGWGPEERMRAAAARALALDPDEPRANAALLIAVPLYGNWGKLEPRLAEVAARTDAHPAVIGQMGSLLQEVGRFADSVDVFRRVNGSLVINPVGHMLLVQGQWASGDESGAELLLATVERRFPGNPAIWPTALRLRLFGPRPQDALPLLESSNAAAQGRHPDELAALSATAEALADGGEAARERALGALEEMRENTGSVWLFVPALTAIGATDRAIEALQGYFLGQGELAGLHPATSFAISTRYLFLPPMRALWRDSRFQRLLKDTGLETYWRQSGTTPDFRRLSGTAGPG